jgi:2-haloacid dehalogenase
MALPAPALVLFDVNETLSDMSALRTRFGDCGLGTHVQTAWFAGVLRDGFALTAAGRYADFLDLARDGLLALLDSPDGPQGDPEQAADHILAGFAELPLHAEVPAAVRTLHKAGFRMATMTNGSAALTERLLDRAGIADCFEALLDVAGPRCWKPAAAAYRFATDRCGVPAERALLVAVHPWDVDGAQRAGLAGAWLRRGARRYPASMLPPGRTAEGLADLADALIAAS